jgi:hypothetical protein
MSPKASFRRWPSEGFRNCIFDMDIAITLTDSEDQCLPLDHRGHKRRFEGDTNDSEHEDDSGADEDLNSDANHEGDGDADSGSSFEALVSSRAKRTRATVRVRNDDDESTDVDVTVARAQPEEAELFTYKETAVSLMVGRGSRQSSQTERNAVAATADAAHKDRVLSLWSTTERPKKVAKVASGAASNAATVAARQSSQTTSSQVMRYTSQTSVRATQATTQASQTTQRELSASGSSTIDITTTQTTSARAPTTSSAALTSKQAKQATAAAKKAQREAAKRQRAEQRAADKRAKAADKEARRLHSTTEANAEIVVCADTRLAQQVRTGDPTTVLQAMQAQKVEHCVTQLRVERSLIWCRLVESRVARGTVIELSDGRRVCREPFAAICFTGAEFMRAARDDRLFELADAVRRANVDDTSVIFIVEGLDRAIVEHERARVHLLSPSNQARSAAASAFDLQKFERMWHIVRLQLAGVHVQVGRCVCCR